MPHHAAPPPPAATTSQAATAPQTTDDGNEICTGSIIVVPRDSGRCWRLHFDSRIGNMWAGSYAACNDVTETMEIQQKPMPETGHMQAIRATFQKN